MKSLLFLLAIGLASSDKLDRSYLPPPGSKFAGGSPGAIDVPLEYPKQPYSTTLPPLLPGDFQATVGIDRGIQDQDILGPPPSNYGQKLPTTTTSYAFTQTTTFPPAEGFETTIIPGQEYPGDGSFGDQQAGLGNYPQNYDQQLNVQGPAFGQPGQTVSQTGLLPTQGTTIQPGFPSQFGQGFDRRPGYKQPPNLGQYQQTFGPSSTISPINNISQTPGFVPQAPYGQNQGSNQYLGVQPSQESFGQEGSYRPGIATQYGDDTNNVQETFPGNNIPQQLGAQGQSQFIGQQVPSTTARPQGIPPNYQPGLRPQYGNNIVQGIRGLGSNIGQQLEGIKPYGQPGLLPTTGAPVIPGYQPGSSTQFGPAGSGIDGTQQFGNQRPIPGQAGSLPSTVSPQGIPGYRPGTSDQYGQKVSPGINRPGTTTQQVSGQRPGQTQQGISPTTLGPQGIYQPSSTLQYGENISQGTTIPGVGQQLGGQRPGIDQQGIVLPSSSPLGYQPGTSQYSGDLDNIRGIPGSSLPGQQTQPQINQNQYQATSGGQRPTQQYPSSVKPDGNAFRGDGQTIYRPDGTVTTSVLPSGYNQPTFPSTTPSSFSSYGTTAPGNVSPTTPGYNQGTVFPTGSQRLQRPQADADRNAVILNYENVLTPEGFSYSFDTSNGIHADESGTAVGGVKAQGSYSYTGDDGKFYEVIYSADENGFQPRGDHLPTPPPIPEAIKKVIEQAAKDKAAGILHDGSYDEDKYGHKKYQGMMLRYRPKIQKESIANGADIPDEYDSQFIRDNKKKLGQPGATTDDITDETEYDEFSGDEDLQANMEKLRGDGRRPSSGIPGRFPSNAPSKNTYENFNGERITQNINQQPKGPISGTRKEYLTGNEEFSTRRPIIPGQKGNRPYSSKDTNDGFQDYEILDKNYDYGFPGQGYNTDTRLPSRPSEIPEEKEVRLLQKKPTGTIQQTDRPEGPKRPIGSGSKYGDQTYDTELMNNSDYNTRPSQQKRPNKVFNNQNVGSEDGSEDYYQPDGEQTVTRRPIGSKRPGISGSRYNENQNLRSQTRKPGQSRQPGQSRRPDESIQTNAAGQFDRPRQPGELRQPGKPNQPDTYRQGGDYRRPGEPSLTSSQEGFSSNRGETPNDITLEQNKVNRPGYNEQVNTEDKYSSQRPIESSGYQYIPPQNKFELDRNKYPVGFTDMKDISSTRRPTTQYNISKGTTPRPFITPNVFEDEDRTSVTRKPGKVTSSPITTQNDHGTTDYLEYDDKDLDQEIGDDTITSTRKPGQSGITTIGSTRRPYSQTQQTTTRPQYYKEYLPGGQRTQPGSKVEYTEDYESGSEGTLIPGDMNYNGITPTSKTPGYIYTSTTPLPSRYPEQYGTRRPGINQQPTTQYTTFRPTSGPYDDESTIITKRPVTNTGVTSGRPVYSDRTNTFPSSTTIRPTTPGTYTGLGDDYDRTTAPGPVTVRPSSRLSAERPGIPGRPMSDYSDRTDKPGSVTLRPGTVGTSQITGRPTQEPADYADYNQSGQSSRVSGRPAYSEETTTAITTTHGTNRIPGRPGAVGNLPSTTYRPSLYTERTQTKPSVTVDAYGRPITEQPGRRIPTTTFRPESSPRLPVQGDYQIGQNPSQIDSNQGVPYQPNASQFGSQEFAPGQLPNEEQRPNEGQVETGGSYGPYPSSTTTERIIGEDFSGPKQAQKFDSKTGYYY